MPYQLICADMQKSARRLHTTYITSREIEAIYAHSFATWLGISWCYEIFDHFCVAVQQPSMSA
jgi:hypothetical protein